MIFIILGSWHQLEFSDSPLPYAALIEDLKPASKYTFRVIAEGPAGRSSPSDELVVRTEPQRPAGPPLNPTVRPVSSTEILVTWSPPLPELRHGDIQVRIYNILITLFFVFYSKFNDSGTKNTVLFMFENRSSVMRLNLIFKVYRSDSVLK